MPYANQADRNAQARRRIAAGYCASCGDNRINATHCAVCRDILNVRLRGYHAAPPPLEAFPAAPVAGLPSA